MNWTDAPVFGTPPAGGGARVRLSAYAIIADPEARIAVVHTPQGLHLPGGGLDPGETAADSVVREVREECGLEVIVGSWIRRAVDFIHSAAERTHFEKRSVFMDAHMTGRQIVAVEPDHELEWLAPPAAMARLLHPGHRWAVGQWITARHSG